MQQKYLKSLAFRHENKTPNIKNPKGIYTCKVKLFSSSLWDVIPFSLSSIMV